MESWKITEQRNPRTMDLHTLDSLEIVKRMNDEDILVAQAVQEVLPHVAKAVDAIGLCLQKGGRLLYVGVGTSGRLGVLDAVECVPTFGVDKDLVVGILAGGPQAMFVAQEDLEDYFPRGQEEMEAYEVGANDAVVGIAASGTTPFVLGAMEEARKRGAFTIGLVCAKGSPLEKVVDIAITPVVGPEVITGSTRLKAGTAQKMVLNMLSTATMIGLGKVYSNLMVDVKAGNEKLRQRALRIFCELTGADVEEGKTFLREAEYSVKEAVVMYCQGVSREKARELLLAHRGFLWEVIG